jgi:hypothetical protein
MMEKKQPFDITVLNVTAVTYACQEAVGAAYRRPLLSVLPHGAPSITPGLLAQLWAKYWATHSPQFGA